MKKIISLLIISFIAIPLFSSSISAISRADAVLTSNDTKYAFSHNPAFLAAKDYSISIPVNARLYNAKALLSNDIIRHINDLGSEDEEKVLNSLLDILREFNSTMPLMRLSERLSFSVGGFGMNLSLKEEVVTSGGSVGTTLSASILAELSSAFAFQCDWDEYSLEIGVKPKLLYSVATSPVGIDTAVGILIDNSIADNVSLNRSMAVALDAGAYASFPHGLRAAIVLRDIGFTADEGFPSKSFSFDTALGYGVSWSFLSLDLEAGLRDITGVRTSVDLMRAFNAGLSIGITDFITINAGINGGYPSFGAGLDLFFINIAVAYYYQDYGVVYGLCPRDVLALEVSLSF